MADRQGRNVGLLKGLFKAIEQEDVRKVGSIVDRNPQIVNLKLVTRHGCGSFTPLIEACYTNSWCVVNALIDKGADVHATGYVLEGFYKDKLDFVEGNSRGKLHGGFGCYDDIFPLFIAAKRKAKLIMDVLLMSGKADVNQTNAIGQTALHRASMANAIGQTALHRAIMAYDDGAGRSHFDTYSLAVCVMKKLIVYGADVNLKDRNGKTPLHYACETESTNMIKVLLDNGADLTVTDSFNLRPLDIVAFHSYEQTEAVLRHTSFEAACTPKDMIETYELVACSRTCPSQYDILRKAAQLRKEHSIPKVILQPMECYNSAKECETFEELEQHEGGQQAMFLQALLARERVLRQNGRYFDMMTSSAQEGILEAGLTNYNELQLHHLELVETFEDQLYYGMSLSLVNRVIMALIRPEFVMENGVIIATMEMVYTSLEAIQEELLKTRKPGKNEQLIIQYKKTMLMATQIISLLYYQSKDEDRSESMRELDKSLLNKILESLLSKFPHLEAPFSGYRAPLSHVLLDHRRQMCVNWPGRACQRGGYDFEHTKLLIAHGLDIHGIDSAGNNILHIIVSSDPDVDVVSLLLEEGIQAHERNNKRQTPLDMMQDPNYTCENLRVNCAQELLEIALAAVLPLKCLAASKLRDCDIQFENEIPECLVQFVKCH